MAFVRSSAITVPFLVSVAPSAGSGSLGYIYISTIRGDRVFCMAVVEQYYKLIGGMYSTLFYDISICYFHSRDTINVFFLASPCCILQAATQSNIVEQHRHGPSCKPPPACFTQIILRGQGHKKGKKEL